MITSGLRPPTVAVFPGALTDYFSTPDSDVFDQQTRDMEIIARVTCAKWGSVQPNVICVKWGPAGQRQFGLATDVAGKIGRWYSVDGTAIDNDRAVLPVFADNSTQWIRMYVHLFGNALFYWAVDQPNEPIDFPPPFPQGLAYPAGLSNASGWQQMAPSSAGVTGYQFASTAPLTIGAAPNGTVTFSSFGLKGTIHRLIVRMDSATVADFNPQDAAVNDPSWVSRATGETWTKNGAVLLNPPDQALTAVKLDRMGRSTFFPASAFATVSKLAKKGTTTFTPGAAFSTVAVLAKAQTTMTPATAFSTVSVCGAKGRTTTMLGLP